MTTNDKIATITPKYLADAKKTMSGLSDEQVKDVAMYMATQFIEEIRQALAGDIDLEEAPFFTMVNEMFYEADRLTECYFCNQTIDGVEVPFDADEVKVCASCQSKVGNLMKSLGIDPKCLFPLYVDNKKQAVLYEKLTETKPPEGEVVH